MKKKLYLKSTLLLSLIVLALSSCLKDSRYVDFSKATPVVEFNLGGLTSFGPDAISAATDTVTEQFAVSVSTASLPTTPTTITLAIDNAIVTSYDAGNTAVNYLPFPANAFSFTNTKVTIPAGQRVAIVPVTFYLNKIDKTQSYMLPIKIAGTTGGYTISGNMGIHYYHFIGNVFAGTYTYDYTRTPPSGNIVGGSAVFSPVTPTQFEAFSGYYTGNVRYEVTFTQTGTGAGATYSNFQVTLNSDDVTKILNANGISVTTAPFIKAPGYDPTKQYTYAQALTLFDFEYVVLGGSGARTVEDRYYLP